MIKGIGVDLVMIVRVKEKGFKLAPQMLTERELSKWHTMGSSKYHWLAKAWAVKEATVKALGTGFGEEYKPKDIEYISPHVHIKGEKMDNIHLSVSDEGEYAIAYVVIEHPNTQ